MVTVRILDRKIAFKVVTSAAVTAISYKCYETLGKPELKQPNKSLQAPDSQSLNVVRQFEANISLKCKSSKQHSFVVDNYRVNLLGLPGIVALNLVSRIDNITDCTAMVE